MPKTDVRPIWICVGSIAKYLPPPLPTSGPLISWQLADDCEQNIPQLDDYRRCHSALDKQAFFLSKKREQQSLSQWRHSHSIGISWIENIKRSYSEITRSSVATFVLFCQMFVQRGRNRPCVSMILWKQTSEYFEQAWYTAECSSPSIQDIKKNDISRHAFNYADFESVLKIFLSFKVINQIGS